MKSALIGHTGFVGGNLLSQGTFTHTYNSKTIESIRGEQFDLLICAGAPAEKWRANRDPDADWASLQRLMTPLKRVRADRAILISTVDVFGQPVGVDETTLVEPGRATPYGRHRRLLELFFQERFDTLVVRLPGLFGPGLKKNAIYDFLHHNQIERIPSASAFQFYDLADLTSDLNRAVDARLSLLHCGAEPVTVAEMARSAFDIEFDCRPESVPVARYDMRTRHAAMFGGVGGYLRDKRTVLSSLRRFVSAEKQRLAMESRRCA